MSDVKINRESLEEALKLSEDILSDIELGVSLGTCALRASRLARLIQDFDYQRIFFYENSGYPSGPNGITPEVWSLCKKAERVKSTLEGSGTEKKEIERASTKSISATLLNLDALNESLKVAYDPNISLTSANPNQYVGLGNSGNSLERQGLRKSIKTESDFISERLAFIYNYVSTKNYELKFSNISSDIFSRTRSYVDASIGNLIPQAVQKFSSVYDNLKSDNAEDWSNAVHSCRRILQDLADAIFPARDDLVIDNPGGKRKVIKLGKDNYINRIIAYVESQSNSERFIDIVGSNLGFLGDRLDAVFKAAQKGSHDNISSHKEADRYVIYTYLIIGDVLSLVGDKENTPSNTPSSNVP
ncbi:hypothetical protein PO369_04995 [Phytobacter diazotrophicus]|uniref:hypothetical protein n=1 Tax=Phytobacter diazotrophicus TaxID=395631 RepID=UPI002FFBB904